MKIGLLVILSSIASTIRGECGFPGRPKFGSVRINEVEVTADGSVFDTGSNATYRCDASTESEQVHRICEADGRWTGSVPECLHNLAMDASVIIENSMGNDCFAKAFHDGHLSRCAVGCIQSGTRLRLNFDASYRLDSIAIFDNGSLSKAQWTPRGINADQSASDLSLGLMSLRKVNQSTHVHVLVQDQRWWRSIDIEFDRVPRNYLLCAIEIFGFPDDCGEPEEPSNGRVYRFGNSAIYQCDPGFRLDVNSAVRNCSGGRWTTEQPVCVFHENAEGLLMASGNSWIWILVGFVCGILLISSGVATVFFVVKKRFVRQRKRSATLLLASMNKNVNFELAEKGKEYSNNVEENIYEELRFVQEERYVALTTASEQTANEKVSNYEDPITINKTHSDQLLESKQIEVEEL